jgi:hypothetical protein
MIKNVTQFFADLKATSKYLWYLVKFIMYMTSVWLSFYLLNLASTIGNLLGLFLLATTVIIWVIRSIRVIKTWVSKLED